MLPCVSYYNAGKRKRKEKSRKRLNFTRTWRVRASTKSMLCHRKPASSLSMDASICCKMAFPGNNALKRSFYGRKLIEEATFCCSSDRQSRSCGLLMKGLRPLHTFPKFVDSLSPARSGAQSIDKVDALPSKVCKQVFRWEHQFAVKWHFQAIQPGNAHFTAAN